MSWERNGPNHAFTGTVYQVGNYFSRWKNYVEQKDKKCLGKIVLEDIFSIVIDLNVFHSLNSLKTQ